MFPLDVMVLDYLSQTQEILFQKKNEKNSNTNYDKSAQVK